MRRHLVVAALLVAVHVLPGCRPKVVVSAVDRANCSQEVEDAFGPQDASLVALRARDGGPLFRPPVLEALDRVCQAFEEEMTDDLVAAKCLTNLPIMEGRPSGARVVVARDEMPFTPEEAARFQRLVLQLEFARGDVVDASGGLVSYLHLPHGSFEGVDLEAVFAAQVEAEADTLEMALDQGRPEQAAPYRKLAGDGPSSAYFVGLFDSGSPGGMKDPPALAAVERWQLASEASPRVPQTFSMVDDLKVVRRGLHKGNPAEALIPPRRSEVAQLLLMASMAPASSMFGPRMDSAEQVALLRVNLSVTPEDAQARLGRRLDGLLGQEALEGGRAFLCLDDAR